MRKRTITVSSLLILCVILAGAAFLPAATGEQEKGGPESLTISMNFQNTDIRQIIDFIKDITGRVIVVDERVKGTVTIVARDRMAVGDALKVLNSALKAKGYTLVRTDRVTRVIPVEESVQSNVETHIGAEPAKVEEDDIVITQVVPLERVAAAQLRADLKSLVGEHGDMVNSDGANSLIITDTAANVKRVMRIIEYLDRESVVKSEIKVYTLDYARAAELAAILSQLPKNTEIPLKTPSEAAAGEKGAPVRLYGEMTVLADERSNSLIVATSPSNFASVETILKSLDSMLSQVLIEVVIMEVSLTGVTQMGMEWYFEKTRTIEGKSHTMSADLDLDLADENFGLKTSILREGGAIDFLNFLLKTEEKINILSTPMIMTSDNKKASINVGSEVPYLKETRRSTGDTRDYVYEYRDVGIGLEVTPHINDQRFVVLDIRQEIKKLGPKTLFDAYIIISRTAEASVVVKDRQTVILGGLIRDDTTKTKHKVPFLGDLPVIGSLFRKTSVDTEKTELLVFITPYIVTSAEEMQEITDHHKQIMQKLPK